MSSQASALQPLDNGAVRPGQALATDERPGATWLVFAALAALVCVTPFETTSPWATIPGQRVTNVEWAAAALLVLSATTWWRSGRRALRHTSLGGAWVALVCALLASALAAPLNAGLAAKNVARLIACGVLAIATAAALTTPRRRYALVGACLAVGVAVAAAAILEARQVEWALRALTAFRPGIHVVGGQIRATGTLQYPTIASMHLELVFALGVGLLLTALDRGRPAATAAVFVALAVVAEGIALTFTRAGLITMSCTLAVAIAWRFRLRGIDAGVRLLGALTMVSMVLLGLSYSGESLWLRLTTESQADWYRAAYDVPPSLAVAPGAIVRIPVRVANEGRITWHPDGDPPFFLSYHWLEADTDRVVLFDGLRSAFIDPVPPGATATLEADVEAPSRAGRYRLTWDVVHEQRLWFSTEGSPSAITMVEVDGPPAPPPSSPRRGLPVASHRPGRLALWRAAVSMLTTHPLLGVGFDNFRWLYGAHAHEPHFDNRVHTNNMYLELLVSGGLVGGLAGLWLLTELFRLVARAIARGDRERWIAAGAVCALVAFLVHGLVDSFLTFTPSYVMLAVTVGLLVALDAPLARTHAHRV